MPQATAARPMTGTGLLAVRREQRQRVVDAYRASAERQLRKLEGGTGRLLTRDAIAEMMPTEDGDGRWDIGTVTKTLSRARRDRVKGATGYLFPEPVARFGNSPVWHERDILLWMVNGRRLRGQPPNTPYV